MHFVVTTDQPTAYDMLAPTLHAHRYDLPVLRSPLNGALAIIPLRVDVEYEELERAAELHYALQRGLFVLV